MLINVIEEIGSNTPNVTNGLSLTNHHLPLATNYQSNDQSRFIRCISKLIEK